MATFVYYNKQCVFAVKINKQEWKTWTIILRLSNNLILQELYNVYRKLIES